MRGAGAHSVAKCRGLGGYYRVSVPHVGRVRGKRFLGVNHGGTVRHTVEASPSYVEELRPAADGSRPRLSLVILKEG